MTIKEFDALSNKNDKWSVKVYLPKYGTTTIGYSRAYMMKNHATDTRVTGVHATGNNSVAITATSTSKTYQ